MLPTPPPPQPPQPPRLRPYVSLHFNALSSLQRFAPPTPHELLPRDLQGFALFNSAAAARFAVDLVSGSHFDEQAQLRAEMARKNMYLKVRRGNMGVRGARGQGAFW